MSPDQFAEKYPRTARLLASRKLSMRKASEQLPPGDRRPQIVLTEDGPIVHIQLADLESALSGFRDTGTWDDYFPPANPDADAPTIPVRQSSGRARYKLDTSREKDKR